MELFRLIQRHAIRIFQIFMVSLICLFVLGFVLDQFLPHHHARPMAKTFHLLSQLRLAFDEYWQAHEMELPAQGWQSALLPYLPEESDENPEPTRDYFADDWGHAIWSNGDGSFASPGRDGVFGTEDDLGAKSPVE